MIPIVATAAVLIAAIVVGLALLFLRGEAGQRGSGGRWAIGSQPGRHRRGDEPKSADRIDRDHVDTQAIPVVDAEQRAFGQTLRAVIRMPLL